MVVILLFGDYLETAIKMFSVYLVHLEKRTVIPAPLLALGKKRTAKRQKKA